MATKNTTQPTSDTPEAHWGTTHPESQPCRDEVLGLGRLIADERARLGRGATPEKVAAELKARGMCIDAAEIARCWHGSV